jgi:cell division protein FtsL
VKQRPFLALWTLAVLATVAAFVLHLGLRGRTVDLGYKLGRARAEQARLREMKRVLSLEAASYETPQRVEMVARTLLGMNPPPPERVIPLKPIAPILPPEDSSGEGDSDQDSARDGAASGPRPRAPAEPSLKPPAPASASASQIATLAPPAGAAPPPSADAPAAPIAEDLGAAPSDIPAALPLEPAPFASQGAAP